MELVFPKIKQKYLFTATEIESTPGTENEKGTGLGLKLCQELVKINHGSITVESKEGEGTCFIITLPVEKESVVQKLKIHSVISSASPFLSIILIFLPFASI